MPPISTAHAIWPGIRTELARQLPHDIFEMWFKPVESLEGDGDTLVLGAPNEFAAIWIHDNYLDLITQLASAEAGDVVGLLVLASPPGGRMPASMDLKHLDWRLDLERRRRL